MSRLELFLRELKLNPKQAKRRRQNNNTISVIQTELDVDEGRFERFQERIRRIHQATRPLREEALQQQAQQLQADEIRADREKAQQSLQGALRSLQGALRSLQRARDQVQGALILLQQAQELLQQDQVQGAQRLLQQAQELLQGAPQLQTYLNIQEALIFLQEVQRLLANPITTEEAIEVIRTEKGAEREITLHAIVQTENQLTEQQAINNLSIEPVLNPYTRVVAPQVEIDLGCNEVDDHDEDDENQDNEICNVRPRVQQQGQPQITPRVFSDDDFNNAKSGTFENTIDDPRVE